MPLNDQYRQAPPSLFSRLLKLIVRSMLLLGLLFLFDKLLPTISQQSQRFVVAKWQQVNLLQQPLPTDNSLPSPLLGQHLTDTWGGARSEGRRHEGIDIFAPRNTPIKATTQGVVSKVGDDRLGGKVVVIVGPGGAGHYYAHLEDYADISPNQWIEAGDTVGYVGDSGNAKGTPPHVHYGVYINGSAVNPYPLLIKAK
ncbi:M23 family metallopeptidase [Psychrobacter sp. TAE2020]|uniref:M23 family metallopeptidase n=1 Tax=Psychrobacter sp. TAE2020 TaxID=2846762 RepID=UPI001E43E542|nr:M23 family metallopeptidase [Psychrobacter sp. TAE2020]